MPGLLLQASLSKGVWAAECACLTWRQASGHKGGSVPHRPFCEEKPLSPGRPAGGAWSAAHRRGRGAAFSLSARISRACSSGLRYFMSRQRLALGRMNACFCLLSYFIYIF